MTDHWLTRLTQKLEPLLRATDPRRQISAYHDMPYAIFRYPPEGKFAVRKQLTLLRTRLEQSGKRVNSRFARGVHERGIKREGPGRLGPCAGREGGRASDNHRTVHGVLSDYEPLDELVAQRIPADADPLRDIVFIVRPGRCSPSTEPRRCSCS